MGWINSILKNGSQGEDTSKWQEFLNSQGYDLDVDGIFGPLTTAATKAYQSVKGLVADGIAGIKTLAAASKDNNTETNFNASTPTYDPFEYEDFTYDDYKEGQSVTDALDKKNKAESDVTNYGDFSFSKQNDWDSIYDQYKNRGDFSYDFNTDALYQQYKDKYIQQGKMAMADTMGQAAAMTGGYGNSYAQTVGNQAYQAQLQNLNDVIPQLYQMAYDRYNQKGQDMLNMLGLLDNERNFEYGTWSDGYNRLVSDRDYYGTQYNNERTWDYGKYSSDRDLAHDEHTNKQNVAYENHKNAFDNEWKQAEWELTNDQWEWQKSQASSSSSGSGSGNKGVTPSGVNYDNGSVSTEDIKAMQEAIGVGADGYWGPKSTEAAGGLTADEAYEAWKNGELGGESKGWNDFDQETLETNQKEVGGSYYATANAALKEMNANGATYEKMISYIQELVANSFISKSEYSTLLQWIRTTKNEDSNIHNKNRRYGVTR